jgi:hypothetical protein
MRLMVTLNESMSDEIRRKFAEESIFIIFESKLIPLFIGVEAESLDKVKNLPFVDEARHEMIGTIIN